VILHLALLLARLVSWKSPHEDDVIQSATSVLSNKKEHDVEIPSRG